MSDKHGQRRTRTVEEIRRNDRAHRDGSGTTAAIAMGGAAVVLVIGLLWWLT